MMAGPDKDWKACGLSPYVHWWNDRENLYQEFLPGAFDFLRFRTDLFRLVDEDTIAGGPVDGYGYVVPIPAGVKNDDWFCQQEPFETWLPSELKAKTPGVEKDSVIVGVIDEGIALGHERFRLAGGGTRFLAAWMQGTTWQGDAQEYLPFGREVYRDGIDAAIAAHSRGDDPKDWLDEEAFNRALGLVEVLPPLGPRALMRRETHGSAALDLATGAPRDAQDLDRLPIIAVGLPRRETVGIGGIFLEYFLFFAIRRIVNMADAIWKAHFGDASGGFPIVINLSYGQHSGPKDGRSLFEKQVKALIKKRRKCRRAPLRVVMPLGNDNLLRGNARSNLVYRQRIDLGWQIQPEDQTSNFIEVWSPVQQVGRHGPPRRCPFSIRLRPPGVRGRYWRLEDGAFEDVPAASGAPVARIYCERVEFKEKGKQCYRFRYLVCALRTAHPLPEAETAPAGRWDLTVRNDVHAELECYVMVQVDQAPEPYGVTSRRSYLVNKAYRTHIDNLDDLPRLEDGRPRDSFDYPVLRSKERVSNLEPWNRQGPIQRKGTHNALANLKDYIAVLGGYRASDGRPAAYSATTLGDRTQGKMKRPTAALPTEDGPMHFGVLAAGSVSGSVVAMRGTSFASALATRLVAQDLLMWHETRRQTLGSPFRLRALAKLHDPLVVQEGAAASMKVGYGRIPAPPLGRRVSRRG